MHFVKSRNMITNSDETLSTAYFSCLSARLVKSPPLMNIELRELDRGRSSLPRSAYQNREGFFFLSSRFAHASLRVCSNPVRVIHSDSQSLSLGETD